MALSVQNKNFLSLLHRLDIDVKQFPDKTFDGLFDNVPEGINYFFDWFIENITPDNALTQSEQADYFQLESSHSLPSEEELNYVLSSCKPSFEDLINLDTNYINNILSQELDDLKTNYEELSNIYSNIETNCNEVKKKQSHLKEEINVRKKQMNTVTQDYQKMNLLFQNKLDEVKMFLFKEIQFSIDLDLFNNLLIKEKNIFDKFKNSIILENEMFDSSKLDILTKLEDDLTCVEISMVLSEGFVKEKKAKIEFLSELTQKKSQKNIHINNLLQSYFLNYQDMENKIMNEIKILEEEIFERKRKVTHFEIQKVSNQYLLDKIDINREYISHLNNCKDYIESNWEMNSLLLDILLKCNSSLEDTLSLKKQLYSKLNEYETKFSNELSNLELRKQRFREVQQNQHPLLGALKNIMNLRDNPETNEETLKNIFELMLQINDDSDFSSHNFRNKLQSSIKSFFNNILCGPTSQLTFAPTDLVNKLQRGVESENKLSQAVKKLASKYVETKETIAKSDRRKLLLWIESLTKLPASQIKITDSFNS